jgi:hypothetical protein
MMADSWEYHIGEPDTSPVYKDIFVTTVLEGIDQLSDECQNQIYMSLDVQVANGVWLEIWSDQEKTADTVTDYINEYSDKIDE